MNTSSAVYDRLVQDDVAYDDDLPYEERNASPKLKKIARITVMHDKFAAAVKAVENAVESCHTDGEPICVRLFSEQGCGKSHISNLFLRRHPAFRVGSQLVKPVVRIRVPSDPTIKGVSIALLSALGDPFATKGTDQEMAERIDDLLPQCGAQLVIVEELQHFVDAESEKRNIKVANWWKIRIEETGVPVLAEGLPRTEILFHQDPQLEDRFDGPYYLTPFIWFEAGEEPILADMPFRSFLHSIWEEFPFTDCLDFGTGDNALRFFCASQGVPRRIGKLLKQAARMAERNQSETISLKLLSEAYNIRTGYQFTGAGNPFSLDFNLDSAAERLRSEARKPLRKNGEGVSTR